MLQATFPKMISFDLQLDPALPHITADRSQIHQVLLNLVRKCARRHAEWRHNYARDFNDNGRGNQ